MKNTVWVCVSKGELVGIDNASGGYPWRPTSLAGVNFFDTIKEAQKYCDVWNKGDGTDSSDFADMRPAAFSFKLTEFHRSKE